MIKNNSKQIFKEEEPASWHLIKIFLSTIGLFAASVGSVFLTDLVMNILRREEGFKNIVYYSISGLVLAIIIVLIGVAINFLIGNKITNLMFKSANDLKKATDEANKLFFGEDNKSGALSVAENIIELHNKSKNIDNILISTDSFEKIQDKFFEITKIRDISNLHLYIVGTMIGTFNKNSLQLSKHLTKLAKENNGRPFETASFCSPGFKNIKRSSKKRDEYLSDLFSGNNEIKSLYPFASRFISSQILLDYWKNYRIDNYKASRLKKSFITINLYFVEKSDIFPAIQLWGNQAAMILPSAGYEDRNDEGKDEVEGNEENDAVNEAMPVAIVFRKKFTLEPAQKKCNLNETLKRIENHLKQDYNMNMDEKEINKTEKWQINANTGNFYVKNYISLYEQKIFTNLIDEKLKDKERAIKEKGNYVKEVFSDLINNNKEFSSEEFETFVNSFNETLIAISG